MCFAVSHTGATRETVTNARDARAAGARTIVLTSFARSPITEHADVVLVAGGPEMSFRMEAMTSRVAHLSVLDALFVAVASRGTERANAALDAYADMLSEHRYRDGPGFRQPALAHPLSGTADRPRATRGRPLWRHVTDITARTCRITRAMPERFLAQETR